MRQFKSVDPKLTINEHLGVLPTGTSYRMNYVLSSVKASDFTQNSELQNSYSLTADRCSVQAQALNALTALTPTAVFLVRSFTAKRICLHEPVHVLNLNRRSISGLEPEMLVTIY